MTSQNAYGRVITLMLDQFGLRAEFNKLPVILIFILFFEVDFNSRNFKLPVLRRALSVAHDLQWKQKQ